MPRKSKSVSRKSPARKSAKSAKSAPRRFVVRQSGIHGRGVFALVDIPKGTRLIEYLGERMSHKEADRRYGDLHEGSAHTMLFAATDEVVIDATKWGSSARWINHSCAPNCEAVEEDGRVYVETLRAIRAGQELGYDYELIVEGRQTEKLKREHACYCGAKQCRGTMLGPKR
jgi:SET domain-containing protein